MTSRQIQISQVGNDVVDGEEQRGAKDADGKEETESKVETPVDDSVRRGMDDEEENGGDEGEKSRGD